MSAKHALLIGVDKYCNLDPKYELSGCVNDAKLMKRVLVDHFNFDASSITELHDAAASRDGIIREMYRLVETVNVDDVIVFHFSGHGSRRTAVNADEGSGKDSTIMPYDSGRKQLPNLDIVDDEIQEWLERLALKTRHITLIFDCCHSGTVTRDVAEATVRAVEDDDRSIEAMGIGHTQARSRSRSASRNKKSSGWLTLSDSYVVMSGCRDTEKSREFYHQDGGQLIRNGALTHFVTQALMQAKPGSTYRDVFESARRSVTNKFPSQHPQIQGTQDREIFGVRDIEPLRFVPVAAVEGDSATLNGGAAHGLHSGSRWTAYPPDTKATDETIELGVLEVTRVGALTTDAKIIEKSAAIPAGARCVERQPSTTQYRLTVDLSGLPQDAGRRLQARIDSSALLALTDAPEAADVKAYILPARESAVAADPVPQIDRIAEPTWAILDREGNLAMPLHATSEDGVIDTLVVNLEKLARYRNALALENAGSALDVDFNIYRQARDGEWRIANGGDAVFEEGERIAFELVNRGAAPVYLSVLDFGLTGKISLLYPRRRRSEMVAAGQPLRLGMGKGRLCLSMPPEAQGEQGTETFKAFITSDEADFTWLQQDGMRSAVGSGSQLRAQFEAAYNGPSTRDVVFDGGEEDEADHAWTAISRSFEVRRRS